MPITRLSACKAYTRFVTLTSACGGSPGSAVLSGMRSTLIDHEPIQIHCFNYQVSGKGQSKIVKNTRAGRVLAVRLPTDCFFAPAIVQPAPSLTSCLIDPNRAHTADHLCSGAAWSFSFRK